MNAVVSFKVSLPIAAAESAVRDALATRGFGILTEVDVAATLLAKLGVATAPYRILGACNPALAHAALQAEPRIGAFLPCGIALYEGASAAETIVAIQDPAMIAKTFDSTVLVTISDDARQRLIEAIASVGEPL